MSKRLRREIKVFMTACLFMTEFLFWKINAKECNVLHSNLSSTVFSFAEFNSNILLSGNIKIFIYHSHTTNRSLYTAMFYERVYNWTSGTPDITIPFKHLIHKYSWTILSTRKYGLRPNVPNVVIIVTGKYRSSYSLPVIKYQTNIYLHKHFSNIITVGVGNMDHQALDVIATENNSLYVSSANEFRDLDFGRKLLNRVCN